MTSGDAQARCLAAHAWVMQAYGDAAGMLVLLSPEGHNALRQRGRASALKPLRDHLAAQSLSAPAQWRLLDAAPDATDSQSISHMLQTPRPTQVEPFNQRLHHGCWTLDLRLPPDLVHFDDHFRHAPVLAGVMQVGFALALAAPRLGTSRHCRTMDALKFQRPLRPGDELQLRLRFEEGSDTERGTLHFAYAMEGAHCSSGRLRVSRA